MEVKIVEDKALWEEFNSNQHPGTFLQSWNWGIFNQEIGKKVFRLGILHGDKLVGICQLIQEKSRTTSFLYAPHGPIIDWNNRQLTQALIEEAKKLARSEHATFVRFEPQIPDTDENREVFSKLGFKKAVTFTQPEDTLILDLTQSEEEILANMRNNTRWMVRKEPKDGIRVEISNSKEDIQKFLDLIFGIGERKKFASHSGNYYSKQFEVFSAENQMLIFKALNNDEIVSMALIMFYGDSAYYLHAASHPGAAGGYSIQWAAMLEAKKRGLHYYNFWGVAKEKHFRPSHPWYGFSLFKKGFGGERVSYLRTRDLPLTSKYWLFRAEEHSRRVLKRVRQGAFTD